MAADNWGPGLPGNFVQLRGLLRIVANVVKLRGVGWSKYNMVRSPPLFFALGNA